MSNPLATYLHDHLAGAAFAVDLLKALHNRHSDEALGKLASGLLIDVEQDRETLRGIIDRVGKESTDLKEAAAWLAEKVSRLKLDHDDPDGLGTFQALETLALGIQGKRALWQALSAVPDVHNRIGKVDLEQLIVRAERQYAQVEQSRLLAARTVLARM